MNKAFLDKLLALLSLILIYIFVSDLNAANHEVFMSEKVSSLSSLIQVVPYNFDWALQFEVEKNLITQALRENCLAVHHISSTSVPGLCAKPKLDILVVIKNSTSLTVQLEPLGYQYRGEVNIPFHLYFTKKGGSPKVNLHIYEEENPEIELNILFRDYLRTHPETLQVYANLKLALVGQQSLHEKGASRFRGYTLGKDAFIKETLVKAGFSKTCIRFCTHHDEWQAAQDFRQKYFFDKISIADPYKWTFDHKDHVHFVLYKGTIIIGYAHIKLWPDQRAALRIIVVKEADRSHGKGSHFLKQIEKWLYQQNIKKIHTQSSPEAFEFYKRQQYTLMPFNDPEGYESDPNDIEMRKILILK